MRHRPRLLTSPSTEFRNCGKKHVQVMLSGLVQEKMSSVPKEVTLHQRNHLKENQREPKHQDIEDVMSQIRGLLFPVQLWLGWLRHIVIASCWWADVTFWQDQIKLDFQLRGGVWTKTSHWLRPLQLSHVSIIEPSCGTSSLRDRGVHAWMRMISCRRGRLMPCVLLWLT